jgi:hypothetical protein
MSVALRSSESWTPTGVAVRNGELYVLEYWFAEPERAESWRPRVRKVSKDGSVTVLTTVTSEPE